VHTTVATGTRAAEPGRHALPPKPPRPARAGFALRPRPRSSRAMSAAPKEQTPGDKR
jgi:hypothetical protein